MSTTTVEPIDTADVEPWKIFKALFNKTHQQGMGFLQPGEHDFTDESAKAEWDAMVEAGYDTESWDGRRGIRFDYHRGRVMKIMVLTGDDRTYQPEDFRLFDRDNYPGAAYDAILEVVTAP